jgi:hypothetical protein
MAGDKPPKDAPPGATEQQEMANGTANMLAHAAAAAQASEAESRDSSEGQRQQSSVNTSIPQSKNDDLAHPKRPTRL